MRPMSQRPHVLSARIVSRALELQYNLKASIDFIHPVFINDSGRVLTCQHEICFGVWFSFKVCGVWLISSRMLAGAD